MPSTGEQRDRAKAVRWTDSDGFDRPAVILRFLWVVLLLPWFFFAVLSEMAFDGGHTLEAYVFVISVRTYPITVAAAFLGRTRAPLLVFAPLVHFLGVWVSTLLHHS
jgi:hypothetical protein